LPSLYYSQVSSDPSLAIHIVKPYAWAGLILNSQVGIFTNPLLRKAASYAINDQNVMAAAFGLPEFYSLSGSLFFKQDKNTYSTVGTSGYNQYNPTKAKQLLTEAHYNGQPITFLETKTYMWMYNADQVVAKDMEAVGFNIKPQLNTWQEQLAIRPHLNEWNMFETSYSAESVSPLSELIFQPGYAAKWNSTRLRNYINQYESTSNRQTKLAIIGEIQKLFYQEMPDVMEGVDYSMTVTSSNLKGLGSYYLPVLWNAKIR
jgi:peptide/nickel transport system substrate-binding protein